MKVNIFNTESAQRASDICLGLPTDKRWAVSITEQKESKSLAQLRTIHGWFRFIATEYAEATGNYYSPDAWKYYFKERFGLWVERSTFVGPKQEMKSFEKYSVKEMSTLMESVNHFCGSEFSIFVPIPGEPTEDLC